MRKDGTMKFEIDRLAMLGAAKNAAGVAPTNAPVETLNGILVECSDDTGSVFLTATNHEASIQQKVTASVSDGGAVLVNARMLVRMLSLLPGEHVAFAAASPEAVTVTGGKCAYDISCLPAKHFPKPVMPFPEETVHITGICSLAKRTMFAVSKDQHKPVMQCVNVKLRNNAVHAAACDGTRMMLIKDAADTSDEREFLLPGRSLQMLASISRDTDVFEVGDTGNDIVFTRGDMMFSMRKMPGQYMDTASVIKNVAPAYTAVADASKLKEALGFVAVGSDMDRAPLNMALSGGQIHLRRHCGLSVAHMAVPASISKDTPGTGFYYDIESLVKLFQVISGRVKVELDAKGVMLVKTMSEVYFQIPMRPPKAVREAA